jgi:hypothetical protein
MLQRACHNERRSARARCALDRWRVRVQAALKQVAGEREQRVLSNALRQTARTCT